MEEADHLRGGIGSERIGEGSARVATGPCVPGALEQPVLDENMTGSIGMDRAEFDRRFIGSTLRRTGVLGLRLGAITAAGNARAQECREALLACLNDGEAAVRERAEWALARL